jgi:hypothetical protein
LLTGEGICLLFGPGVSPLLDPKWFKAPCSQVGHIVPVW